MTMAKKKRKKLTSEFWERLAETDRKLLERIQYHKAKSAEQRAAHGEDAA